MICIQRERERERENNLYYTHLNTYTHITGKMLSLRQSVHGCSFHGSQIHAKSRTTSVHSPAATLRDTCTQKLTAKPASMMEALFFRLTCLRRGAWGAYQSLHTRKIWYQTGNRQLVGIGEWIQAGALLRPLPLCHLCTDINMITVVLLICGV